MGVSGVSPRGAVPGVFCVGRAVALLERDSKRRGRG
jgi:hypothetical protein